MHKTKQINNKIYKIKMSCNIHYMQQIILYEFHLSDFNAVKFLKSIILFIYSCALYLLT